ncbi:MAG: hypothetical protein ACRD1M_00770 [Terriglobales bacterium]
MISTAFSTSAAGAASVGQPPAFTATAAASASRISKLSLTSSTAQRRGKY